MAKNAIGVSLSQTSFFIIRFSGGGWDQAAFTKAQEP